MNRNPYYCPSRCLHLRVSVGKWSCAYFRWPLTTNPLGQVLKCHVCIKAFPNQSGPRSYESYVPKLPPRPLREDEFPPIAPVLSLDLEDENG